MTLKSVLCSLVIAAYTLAGSASIFAVSSVSTPSVAEAKLKRTVAVGVVAKLAGNALKNAAPKAASAATKKAAQIGNAAKSKIAQVGKPPPGGAPQAVQNAPGQPGGKTFYLPKEKAANLQQYQQAAQNGTLQKTSVPGKRKGNFRGALEKQRGPPPGPGYDADHVIELCLGGANCAKTNGQWLPQTPNRSAGAQIKEQIKSDPVGTIYSRVRIKK